MKRRIAVFANGWNNLGIAQALKGIQEVTESLNIDIFLFLSYAAFAQKETRNQGEDTIFDLPDYKSFDGAIVFSNMLNSEKTPNHIASLLVENKIPGVSVGIPLKGLSYVGIDNFKGMFEMVDHLVKEHHIKNPAFFAGASDHPDSNERLEATTQALAMNGIELKDENICYTNWEYLVSMKYAMEYCKKDNPPDAFICANDYNAIAACVGLKKKGFSVPKDFIVTGFDKISFADTFYPSITTVYQDFEKIGYMAAWQLMEQIEGTVKEAIKLFGKGARTMERVFYGFFEEQKDGIHEGLQNMNTIRGRDNRRFIDSLKSTRTLLKRVLFYISELEPIDSLKD